MSIEARRGCDVFIFEILGRSVVTLGLVFFVEGPELKVWEFGLWITVTLVTLARY